MFDIIETKEYKGCSIEIVFDEVYTDPLTAWGKDPQFEIYCWHRDYTLGTHQPDAPPDETILQLFYESETFVNSHGDSLLQFYRHWHKLGFTKDEISVLWDEDWSPLHWSGEKSSTFVGKLVDLLEKEGWVYTDVYRYEHSSIALNVSGFSCSWDSGQLGFAICRPETLKKNGWTKEQAYNCLKNMIENTYTAYLNGEVFGWVTKDEEGDEIDSCWGYYGCQEFEYMKECAQDSIDSYLRLKAKEEAKEAERNSYALRNWEIPTYETTCTPKVIVK